MQKNPDSAKPGKAKELEAGHCPFWPVCREANRFVLP
jgi:hypothetical protein